MYEVRDWVQRGSGSALGAGSEALAWLVTNDAEGNWEISQGPDERWYLATGDQWVFASRERIEVDACVTGMVIILSTDPQWMAARRGAR